MSALIEHLQQNRIIPVIVIDNVEHAIPLADSLLQCGFTVLEITLRTPAALACIRQIHKAFPKAILAAGTVISCEQFALASSAGATFAVSPGLSKPLVCAAKKSNLPYLPGVATVSEALVAYELGITHVKFYPAELLGGIKTLSAIADVLPLHFCPTGGINLTNLANYLTLPYVPCVGGTWIAPRSLIQRGSFEEITQLAQQACEALEKLPI